MRALASGKHVTSFSVATNEYVGNGREKAEYHAVIAWERLADICAQYLAKGAMVAVEGRLQTRQWDDDAGKRHWKTEVVAASVEMLSGRRKKDYAADALAAQGAALEPDGLALDDSAELTQGIPAADEPDADELEVAAVA
jgi:single-strand DNA-binding protein